jgi:glycosyltransferase involved in cell wall biosynthesis
VPPNELAGLETAGTGLRAAYVTNAHGVGGAERLLAALVAAGRRRGLPQIVLNPFATSSSETVAGAVAPTTYRGRACSRWRELPALRRWLRHELVAFRPDLVHVMLFQATALAATLSRSLAPSWVVTHAYGEAVRKRRRPCGSALVDRWAIRRFDAVVAISESVRHFLVAEHGLPRQRVDLIAPGWEGEPFPASPRTEREPTVVCVARFRAERGHALLVEAFAKVSRELPSARLVLVGDGPMREAIARRVQELGLKERVEFAGAVPEIWPALAEADVFATAPVAEAAGIAIMEAMAAGLPVVAPNVGGIPELVEPGRTGELCRPGDPDDLARALLDLLRDRQRRERMGAEARRAAGPRRMETTVNSYFALYERLRAAGA